MHLFSLEDFLFLSSFVPELILFLKTVGRATRYIVTSQEQFSNSNQGQLVYKYVSTLSLRGLIQSSYFFYMVSLSSQKDEPLVICNRTQSDDLPFIGFLLFLFSLSLPYWCFLTSVSKPCLLESSSQDLSQGEHKIRLLWSEKEGRSLIGRQFSRFSTVLTS